MTDPEWEERPRPPEGDWLGSKYLRFERRGRVAELTVDRPEARNALTPAMYFGIRYAVDHVNDSGDLDGLIITGSGDVFIPGGDLGRGGPDGWMDFELLRMDVTPFDAIMNSRKPVVAAANGVTQGGGLMIAMLCDVAVASETATFRAPELLRGIADMYYANVLPTQVGPARARDLLLSGRTLSATEAESWGLVSRIVAPEQLLDAARDAMADCLQMAPQARAAVKRGINQVYGRYDRMSMDTSFAGEEMLEGFRAFKQRRKPKWVSE
jgi:enoyl-CoA hydratase/carnithine racemase